MFRILVIAASFCALSVSSYASCPPGPAGTAAEEVRAHGERLICIQNEVAAEARRRDYQFQLDQIERTLRDLQVQRQLDVLSNPPAFSPLLP
jgi:hypothetical protein